MRSAHRGTHLIFVLLGAAVLLAGCDGGPRGDETSILNWGGDFLGGGSTVNVAENIDGDVIITGGQLTFSGTAGGDYLGAGGRHDIRGRIDGDVRAAGGAIMLSGQVAKNVTAAGGRVEITENATVDGNVYLAGQSLLVSGSVGGFVRAAGQEIVLNGDIGGSVDVSGGSLRIGQGARIAGDLSYAVEPEQVTIGPGAQIMGNVTARTPLSTPRMGIFRALWMLGFLVAGGVAVALFPRIMGAAERALRHRPGASLGFGLAWVILVPICALAIAITGIGIPLALIILALYLISLYLGRAAVAVWIGGLVLRSGWPRSSRGRLVITFLVGGALLLLVGLIPYLGFLTTMLATILGLGALIGAYRSPGEHAPEIQG